MSCCAVLFIMAAEEPVKFAYLFTCPSGIICVSFEDFDDEDVPHPLFR